MTSTTAALPISAIAGIYAKALSGRAARTGSTVKTLAQDVMCPRLRADQWSAEAEGGAA